MSNREKIAAFDQIYYTKQRVVFAFIFGRIGCRSATEDLMQQVFMRVWKNIDELRDRPEEAVRAWLFTVARNLATDHLRGESKTEPLREDIFEGKSLAKDVEQRMLLNRLDKAICELEIDQREAFMLSVLGNQTSEQVGIILGKPAGTIRYLVSQARQKIRQEIDNGPF